MKPETKQELERIIAKGGFHSKVAQTVLTSNQMSFKQMEILHQVSDIFFDLDEFPIDATNLKHDASFESMQEKQRRNQSINL